MKKLLHSTLILMLVLMIQLNTVSVRAADQEMAEVYADHIVSVRKMNDLQKLLSLMEQMDDVDAFIASFDSAFSVMFGRGDSAVSVGDLVNMLYKVIGKDQIDERQAVIDALVAEAGDQSLESVFEMNAEQLSTALGKMDELFIIMGNSIIAGQLGDKKMIFVASEDMRTLTAEQTRVSALLEQAAVLVDIDESEKGIIAENIDSFAEYFNDLMAEEKEEVYSYIYSYGFIEGGEPILRSEPTFEDLDDFLWAVEAIIELYKNNIINGRTEDVFDPAGDVTRAELAALSVRLLSLTATGENTFDDITESDWFRDAVLACADNNLVKGIDDDNFNPLGNVSREQVMTIFGRILIENGFTALADEEIEEILADVPDSDQIDDWAREGVALCIKYDIEVSIESGVNDKVLSAYPNRNASRAEVAAMLYRLDAYVETVID